MRRLAGPIWCLADSPAVGTAGCGADRHGQFRRCPGGAPKRAQPLPPKPVSEEETRQGGAHQQLDGRPCRRPARGHVRALRRRSRQGARRRREPTCSADHQLWRRRQRHRPDLSEGRRLFDHLCRRAGSLQERREDPGHREAASTTSSRCSRARCTSWPGRRSSPCGSGGKTVNFNTVGSAANYTGGIVFDRLGIKVGAAFPQQLHRVEKMRTGEIAALVHVVGKPNDLFSR